MSHRNDYTRYSKETEKAAAPATELEPKAIVETVPVPDLEPIPEPIPEPEPIVEATRKTGHVSGCTKLNVRKFPRLKADVVCEIACDTEVEIDEEASTNDFYKICTVSGIEGYCMKSYILEK